MKTISVFLGLILICTFLNAQNCKPFTWTVNFESGYSFGHAPVVGLGIGANFSQFSIRVGFDAHTSDKVNDGLVFRSEIAHTFNIGEKFYGTAGFGHAYLYKSEDSKSLNSNEFLIHPEVGYKFDFKEQPFAFYLSGIKAGEMKILTVGIRGYF